MEQRQAIVRLLIFLSALIIVSITFMIQVPGAQMRYAPLFLMLYAVPIALAARYFGSQNAFWVALTCLSIAALAFCVPQVIFLQVNDSVDIQAITELKNFLNLKLGDSITGSLADYVHAGGTLEVLLDKHLSYTMLSRLWPADANIRTEYWAYVRRPLFQTGAVWQMLALLVLAPFLGTLAEGGVGQRKKMKKANEKIQYLEERLESAQDTRSQEDKEAAGEANRLQSMIITISDMARDISSALQEKTVYKLLLKKTVELLKATKVALYRPDIKGGELILVGSIGYDVDAIRPLRIQMSEEGGLLGWCAKNRLFLSMDEVLGDYHKADIAKQDKLETLYCQPVVRSGQLILIVCVGATEKRLFHKSVARLMSTLANFAAIALENARLMEQTRQQAIRDGLTGLYNHRYFQEYLEHVMEESRTKADSVTCILVDLDFFKRFNDTYGHQAGDEVLRCVAQALRQIMTGQDLVARYGGEEFVAVLVAKSEHEALQIAERMRQEVEDVKIEQGGQRLKVTLSLGVCYYNPLKEDRVRKAVLIKHADEALYQAKKNGRNRVQLYGTKPRSKPSLAKGA